MVRVVAPNHIKPENVKDVLSLFSELIAATRKEAGCLEYRLHTKSEEPGLFVFIEEWESAEALQKHMASEHFKRLIPQIAAFKAKDGAGTVFDGEV
jgi:quinol monooxygenase YgiN